MIIKNNSSLSPEVRTRAVSDIQRYLRQIALESGKIPLVSVDGIFGTESTAAVLAFQELYGLERTGRVDRETWDRLFEEYTLSLYRGSFPAPLPVFPMQPTDYEVSLEAQGFIVSVIQHLLDELSLLYGDGLRVTSVNGIYGEETEGAVRAAQRAFGLEVTGRVDRITWDALVDAYDMRITRSDE